MKIIVKTKKGTEVNRLVSGADSFMIGKGKSCLVDLSGWRVAKNHAEVIKKNHGVFVSSVDKKAEVLVNQEKVVGEYGPLVIGDMIRVGDYFIFLDDPLIKSNHEPATVIEEKSSINETISSSQEIPHSPLAPKENAIDIDAPDDHEHKKNVAQLSRKWKLEIHSQLIQTMDLRRTDVSSLNDDELRDVSSNVIQEVTQALEDFPDDQLDRNEIARQVLAEAVGLGPLEDLLDQADVSEIMVNAFDEIYYEKGGRLVKSDISFSDDKAVLSAIERIVSPLGRRIDESSPLVDARLKDGSRVNAIIPPLALKGPSLTIRKFMQEKLTMERLMGFGSLNNEMINFLRMAVDQHLNIIISGGTGSGKTTLLNALSNFIEESERIVTVEDAAELSLNKPHVVQLEARPPNQEGAGAVTIRDLVKNCLRMRPDRIIVGECRSGEALDMLQAMNTGHDGSLTTVHSNSPRDCVSRLEVLVLMSGMDLPITAIREQIASAVHLVVQQTRFACGSRKITSITEVTGVEGTTVQLSEIFRYRETGYDANGKTEGIFEATGIVPEFYERLAARGIPVDMSIFKRKEAA
ncbi:MAG: ATPase, T2SS/T4P/T4SS family [Cellvibrionales bacterium]|nr:ATPase, T2SS/T4P/T4SS family [Cellvibrionales bacterium]